MRKSFCDKCGKEITVDVEWVFNHELCSECAKAIDSFITSPPRPSTIDVPPVVWISIKDRQPKCIRGISDSVLVHRDNGECEVAYLIYDNDDGFYWYTQDERTGFEFEEVTHWTPLPEPPKDGDTNG